MPEFVDLTVNGALMRCYPHENHTEADLIFSGGMLNGAELRLFLDWVKPGSVVVDVGANAGLYTLMAAQKAGPEGRVIAIEPNRALVDRLKFNVAANNLHNVSVAICAVGETTATRTLSVVDNNWGASTLLTFSAPVGISPQRVAMRPLLQVMQDMKVDRIDAMKIDIEGYEDRALIPFMDDAPPTMRPKAILMEHGHSKSWTYDCIAEMAKHGYRETWRNERDCLLVWNS
jgi:FkbM family methyltransferase